jgi:hypothetical protein
MLRNLTLVHVERAFEEDDTFMDLYIPGPVSLP